MRKYIFCFSHLQRELCCDSLLRRDKAMNACRGRLRVCVRNFSRICLLRNWRRRLRCSLSLSLSLSLSFSLFIVFPSSLFFSFIAFSHSSFYFHFLLFLSFLSFLLSVFSFLSSHSLTTFISLYVSLTFYLFTFFFSTPSQLPSSSLLPSSSSLPQFLLICTHLPLIYPPLVFSYCSSFPPSFPNVTFHALFLLSLSGVPPVHSFHWCIPSITSPSRPLLRLLSFIEFIPHSIYSCVLFLPSFLYLFLTCIPLITFFPVTLLNTFFPFQ